MHDILFYAEKFFFWLLAALLGWNAYILLFNRGVPNIKTAPQTQAKIAEILRADFAARGKTEYNVIDMGSGNGRLTRRIARALPQARVTGIEIAKKSFWWSELMRRRAKLGNLEYKREDFFKYDVSGADAVVFYLSIYEMGRMGEKLRAELKDGALVVSNRFRLGGGWEPVETVEVKTAWPFEREVHVYRR